MTHGVRNFTYRDGRPRWSPGPTVRAQGHRTADLKDENGVWLPLELALIEARKLNEAVKVQSPENLERAAKKLQQRFGYVYFFRGARHVKIGFSNNPGRRSREFATGSAEDLRVMVAVRADRAQEGALHQRFADLRARGEWFYAAPDLIDFIGRVAVSGDLSAELARPPKAPPKGRP